MDATEIRLIVDERRPLLAGRNDATVAPMDRVKAKVMAAAAAASGITTTASTSSSNTTGTSATPNDLHATVDNENALVGLGLVALSAVCFSIVTTLVKYETMHGLTAMEALWWRSIGALILNRVAMGGAGIQPTIPVGARRAMLLQCVFGFGCIAFGFYAISRMVLADASVLIFTSPVLTFFLGACILRERIDTASLLCAFGCMAGLICVVRPNAIFGHDTGPPLVIKAPPIAIIAALLAAVLQALLYISVRRLQAIHSLVITHYFALFSSIAALAWVFVMEEGLSLPRRQDRPLVLWLAAIGSGSLAFVGQLALTRGFQLERAGVAAVMRYLDVVCVFAWDGLILGEPISPWSVLGAGVICLSAASIALRRRRGALCVASNAPTVQ